MDKIGNVTMDYTLADSYFKRRYDGRRPETGAAGD